MSDNRFFYFLCNEGSESFLKEEVALFHPELRFSFSTKGFLTFKLVDDRLRHSDFVFCRHFGEFIKRGDENSLDELKKLWSSDSHKKVSYGLDGIIDHREELKLGDTVNELIKIKADQYYLGKFIVKNKVSTYIGGWLNIDLPEESPSRAYLKIVEGALIANVQFKKGENALEIGSSPGGATYALLRQGLNVIGVDPGLMDTICKSNENFMHHRMPIQEFDPKLIETKIDWLLVDMNLSPEATLNEIEKVLVRIERDFKGAFITLKMTKLALVAKIPFYKKIIHRLGLNPVLLTQLPSHKQEFLLFVTR